MFKKLFFFLVILLLFSVNVRAELIAYYPLDGDATDASDDPSDGTLVGSPTFEAGQFGDAVRLDGSTQYVDCGNPAKFDITGDQVTIMCWVKADADITTSFSSIFSKGTDALKFYKWNNGYPCFAVFGMNWTIGTGIPINDNQWHHICGTYDGTTSILYVDGAQEATSAVTGNITSTTHNIWIGDDGVAGRRWKGLIDDVAIFDEALAQEDIQDYMNNGIAPPGVTSIEEVRISSSIDDVEEAVGNGAIDDTSSDLEIVYDNFAGDDQIIGLRFVDVNIPRGLSITKAYIEFECDEVKDTDPVNAVINGELAPDAAAFTTTAYDVSNRTLTTAQTSWSIPSWAVDDKSQSPDISAVIQEIVNQGDWASGNALVITIRDDDTNPSTGTRTAESYDGESENAPLLHVEFIDPNAIPPAIVVATKPDPANGTSDLPRGVMLSWTPGDYADMHDVYLGTSFEDVNDANAASPLLVSLGQVDAFYYAGGLDYGTIYYWRIDEVNAADMTVYPGAVWNFSTVPIGLVLPQESITVTASGKLSDSQGPENTINLSGLDENDQHSNVGTDSWLSDYTTEPNKAWIQYDLDRLYKLPRMLIWNYNDASFFNVCAMNDITIEYSSDNGANWMTLEGVPQLQLDNPNPTIIDFGGVANGLAVNSIRVTANSNFSDSFFMYGLSEVRFYYIPVWPTEPVPADGATDVEVITTLGWTPGDCVVEHRVYLGTDEQAVTDGTAPSYMVVDPALDVELILGTDYFWRVEEVNMASDPSAWSGPTWSFTTSKYRVVDGFESYTNTIPGSKWSGGSSSTGNGAAIGPVETSIVRNGSQSMQFMFDDTSVYGYSEVSTNPGSLDCGRNWLIGGPQYLVFWIYGDLDNVDTEILYVQINDAKYRNIAPVSEILTPWWTQVTVAFNPVHVHFDRVTSLKIGFQRAESTTGTGKIYIDDIRLYKEAPVPLLPVNPGYANLVAWYKMENNTKDSSFGTKIHGTAAGEPNYVDGPYPGYGMALEFDGVDDYVDLGPSDPFNFTGSFSISMWANLQDATDGRKLIATRGEDNMGFSVNIRDAGFASWLRFTTHGIAQPGFFGANQYVSPLPTVDEWTHITCVYDADNDTKTVYYDGVQINQISVDPNGVLSPSTSNASLGGAANADNTGFESLFNGMLDDVRIYNKVLTEGEIKFLIDPTP